MLYTSGDWYAKPGREDDFVAAWRDLADWTLENVRGAFWARLLRDREDPRHFVSFGPWEDEAAVEAWRSSDGFAERVARIQETVERFETRTLDVAAEVGG